MIQSQDIDYGFIDSVRERILYHRVEGEFDWANVWSNYLAALENGSLHVYIFDEVLHPNFDRRLAADRLLACIGGWSNSGYFTDYFWEIGEIAKP